MIVKSLLFSILNTAIGGVSFVVDFGREKTGRLEINPVLLRNILCFIPNVI
jgi:hypothetical protein